MTTSALPLALLGLVAATSFARPTSSAPQAPAASASASADKPRRDPPPAPLESQAIPTTPSPPPTLAEWQTATPIAVTRRARDTSACKAYRVREWLKIKCSMTVAGITQHGGNPDGVFLWVGPKTDLTWDPQNGGELILPMRPGDRRLLQFFELTPSPCTGIGTRPSTLVDEMWIEGEPGPTVVLR